MVTTQHRNGGSLVDHQPFTDEIGRLNQIINEYAENAGKYEAFVAEFSKDYVDENYLVVALNEEAGEIAGWYKKFVLRGNPTGKFTRDDLKGELGDLLFYLTRMANLNGWSIEDVQQTNMDKLRKRVAEQKRMVV